MDNQWEDTVLFAKQKLCDSNDDGFMELMLQPA